MDGTRATDETTSADRRHRARAVAAMTAAIGEAGYARTTVSDVLERARMSRRTFYRLFDDREDCFLAAYDAACAEALAVIPARERMGSPAQADHLELSLTLLLGHLASHPDEARLLVVEPPAVGAEALERHERTMTELAHRLAVLRRRAGGSALALEACIGAAHRIVQSRLITGQIRHLPTLAPELALIIERLSGPRSGEKTGGSANQ
jgi:AcrR family transcriptional regulator